MDFNQFDNEPVFKILVDLNNFYMSSVPKNNKKEYFCKFRLNTISTKDDFFQYG